MAKLERKMLAHYLDTSFGTGSETWYRIGKDLEEYNVDLSPDTETSKNILGESSFKHNGYEESASAEPYYCEDGDELSTKLLEIIDNRSTGDKLKTKALEVKLWKEQGGSYEAYVQDCYVVPTSYGGDTSGVQIPFTVYYVGTRKKGTFNPETKTFSV